MESPIRLSFHILQTVGKNLDLLITIDRGIRVHLLLYCRLAYLNKKEKSSDWPFTRLEVVCMN